MKLETPPGYYTFCTITSLWRSGRYLPEVPGIYFATRRYGETGEALYIGKSSNLRRRLCLSASHHCLKNLRKDPTIEIGIINATGLSPNELTLLESKCIELYQPTLNVLR